MKNKENGKYVYKSKKNTDSRFFKVNNVCKPQKQNKRHEKNNINQKWVYGAKSIIHISDFLGRG